ncbi:hypothetical protein U1Q18_000484 [Sarracenia purpurea var. burkii]
MVAEAVGDTGGVPVNAGMGGANPRVCLLATFSGSPSSFAADVGLGFRRVRILGFAFPGPRDLGLLFRDLPQPSVSPLTLWFAVVLVHRSAELIWFRRRRWTGVPPCSSGFAADVELGLSPCVCDTCDGLIAT